MLPEQRFFSTNEGHESEDILLDYNLPQSPVYEYIHHQVSGNNTDIYISFKSAVLYLENAQISKTFFI